MLQPKFQQTIRLVHVTTIPNSLRWFRGQIEHMRECGYAISVVSSPGDLLNHYGDLYKVPTYGIPMSRSITPASDITSIARLVRLFWRLKPTVVHVHTPKAGVLAIVAAWLVRVPVRIYHVHGLRYSTTSGLTRKMLIFMEYVACKLATQVLSVSPSVRSTMLAAGICSSDRIKVLLHGSINGIDAHGEFSPHRFSNDDRSAILSRHGIPDGACVVGFVGRIVRDKGVIELAEAWKRLKEYFPNTYLLLVGRIESSDPVPDEILTTLLNDERCCLAGYVTDVAAYMAAIDILVLPSYREGFPTTVLEASAMERPVVTTDAVGCVDSVIHGVTGMCVPVADVDALVEALQVYIRDPILRRQHGNQGRRRVLEEFLPQPLWYELESEYRRLILCAKVRCPNVGEPGV